MTRERLRAAARHAHIAAIRNERGHRYERITVSRHIVTFGQRYRHEPHPILGDHPDLPDGYGVIKAKDYRRANDIARETFGVHYASVYMDTPENRKHYPEGQLFTIERGESCPILTWNHKERA